MLRLQKAMIHVGQKLFKGSRIFWNWLGCYTLCLSATVCGKPDCPCFDFSRESCSYTVISELNILWAEQTLEGRFCAWEKEKADRQSSLWWMVQMGSRKLGIWLCHGGPIRSNKGESWQQMGPQRLIHEYCRSRQAIISFHQDLLTTQRK